MQCLCYRSLCRTVQKLTVQGKTLELRHLTSCGGFDLEALRRPEVTLSSGIPVSWLIDAIPLSRRLLSLDCICQPGALSRAIGGMDDAVPGPYLLFRS